MDRLFNACVLMDYPGDETKHFATMVYKQIKTGETRMKNMIPKGDLVICCSGGSMTKFRRKALCIVHADEMRRMVKELKARF